MFRITCILSWHCLWLPLYNECLMNFQISCSTQSVWHFLQVLISVFIVIVVIIQVVVVAVCYLSHLLPSSQHLSPSCFISELSCHCCPLFCDCRWFSDLCLFSSKLELRIFLSSVHYLLILDINGFLVDLHGRGWELLRWFDQMNCFLWKHQHSTDQRCQSDIL